jgi:hypothetical protein
MGRTFQKKTKMGLREAELFIRNGGNAAQFVEKNTALTDKEREELWNAATSLKESRDYIENFKEKYASEAFRYGYIGKTVTDMYGNTYVQVNRGKHYGYLAAVFDGNDIYIGFTYISKNEKYVHPVIGQAIALKRAVENRDNKLTIEQTKEKPWLRSSDTLQFDHFVSRAKRYFQPDIYSHSRGKEPIEQPMFDEIHIWQYLNYALHAKTDKEAKEQLKLLETSIKNLRKAREEKEKKA